MEGVYKMKRILFLCAVVMGVSFSSALKAETVLYCGSELATGFLNKEKMGGIQFSKGPLHYQIQSRFYCVKGFAS